MFRYWRKWGKRTKRRRRKGQRFSEGPGTMGLRALYGLGLNFSNRNRLNFRTSLSEDLELRNSAI